MCLESSLYTIIDCMWFGYTVRIANKLAQGYLTPAQKALFGTLPTGFLSDHTPPPSPPSSPPAADPFEDVARPHDNQEKPTRTNHLRALQRAIRRRDGPLFLQTMDAINYLLRYLKYPPLPDDVFASPLPNELMTHIRANWAQSSPRGIPRRVLLRIVEETYQRTVGPNVGQLSRYSAFSSEVYGELMPSFTTNVISQTGLRTGSLLVDLGSGVGNVLVQASLSTGCSTFGVEIMAGPAALARSQLQQMRTRCRMWGLRIGDVELVEADMLSNSRVDELLPKADVVLVNNKVFQESRACAFDRLARFTSLTLCSRMNSQHSTTAEIPGPQRRSYRCIPEAVCTAQCSRHRAQRRRHLCDIRRGREVVSFRRRFMGKWRRFVLPSPRGPCGVC